MLMTKGNGWIAYMEFFNKKFSQNDINRVKTSLSREDQTVLFSRQIMPVSKLSLQAVINFLKKADELLGRNDMTLFKDCLRHKAQNELKGIYKIFMSFTSPHYIVKKTGTLWKQLYSHGVATSEVVNDHRSILKVEQVPDMPKYHDISIVAYVEEALKIAGCKNPQGKIVKSITSGDDHCLIEFTWD